MRKLKIVGIIICAITLTQSCNSVSSGPGKAKTKADSASYMIGVSIGYNLKTQEIPDVNAKQLAGGIKAVLENDSSISIQEAQMFLNMYFQELQKAKDEAKIEEGKNFLLENKSAPGVIETESGLQYKILEEGTGASPTEIDSVICHFTAKTMDGKVFQETYTRKIPAEFAVVRNPPGIKEGLQLMKEGGKHVLYIPSNLAYGPRGYGQMVGPNEVVIYEYELLEVIPHKFTAEETANIEKGKKFLEKNKSKAGVIETASGLQYKVITEGSGESPIATDEVTCHYRGTVISGDEFDSSYEKGQPATFPLNGVIRGWTEGLQLMKEGAKFEFYIPSNLAYGSAGSPPRIGPFETLIFEVELIEVTDK